MKDNFEEMIGKRIFIILKSGMVYNGIIEEVTKSFLFIKDKFDKPVVISKEEISSMEEK